MGLITIDTGNAYGTNGRLEKLFAGDYHQDDVIVYNAQEAELKPNFTYDPDFVSEDPSYPVGNILPPPHFYKTLTEVTGSLSDNFNAAPENFSVYRWPLFWLVDTAKNCWLRESDQYIRDTYQPKEEPTPKYIHTMMLGQKRPHRKMMWDLMQLYGLRDENCTFVAEGVTRDIENDYREDINRVAWTGINQIKTHRPPPWYDDIIVDVVVETHEDKRFYTEKTWKPFLNLKIPLIFGCFNMYEQLEKWGFQLRHEIIDYSYDRHAHPYERAKAMVEELKRLNDTYTPEELAELTRQARYHNQRLCMQLLRKFEWDSEELIIAPLYQHELNMVSQTIDRIQKITGRRLCP
tara:strand:+ start:1919 stop:2965 length:1047 start_codon:yes stop_codon:yes gene_type:complete